MVVLVCKVVTLEEGEVREVAGRREALEEEGIYIDDDCVLEAEAFALQVEECDDRVRPVDLCLPQVGG